MRLCVSSPDIREMPRLDRDEARDMTHPGHLQKLYYEWLKTCHGYMLDIILEDGEDATKVINVLKRHGKDEYAVSWKMYSREDDFRITSVESTLYLKGLTADEASKIAIEIKGLMEKRK